NVLLRRALNVPAARNSYFGTIYTLAGLSGSGGWMENEIIRMYNQIHQAVLDDPVKRCFIGGGTFPCSNADFENEVNADIQFARQRGDAATAQIAQLAQQQLYAFNERGGMLMTRSSGSSSMSSISAGYGLIDPDISTPRLDAVALLLYRQGGGVVSETSVAAIAAIRHGP